jgi:integrase
MKAYVLTGEGFGRPERPRPHIFTERELRLFFNAVDAYPPCGKNPRRGLVAQALFRTIYCLGLRPCEAMRLTVPCVDLTRGSVYILQAKGDKDRVVYLSGDLHEALLRYSKEIGTAMPGRKAFFPNWKGDHLAIKNVENWFNELWRSLPGDITAQRKPSIQSLRHTFACRRIRLMAEEGKDLRSSIYYLSEHMGHDSFKETEYYLHLLPERFPELLGKVSGLSDALLPEVVCNG